MKGSRTFRRKTANEITVLLRRTRAAPPAQQKALRQQIRDRGFYISDFDRPAAGFGPAEFRDLERAGKIRIY